VGDGSGCTNLGHCYQHGTGVPKNPALARDDFFQGCALGDQGGCEALKKACRKGDDAACRIYRVIPEPLKGMAPDGVQ
jgi:TPR repeat protein